MPKATRRILSIRFGTVTVSGFCPNLFFSPFSHSGLPTAWKCGCSLKKSQRYHWHIHLFKFKCFQPFRHREGLCEWISLCNAVLIYRNLEVELSLNHSWMDPMFILKTFLRCRSFGEYPESTIWITAELSWNTTRSTSLCSMHSRNSCIGMASENKPEPSETISASVVDLAVDDGFLLDHDNGQNEFGPSRAMMKPLEDLVSSCDEQWSASV